MSHAAAASYNAMAPDIVQWIERGPPKTQIQVRFLLLGPSLKPLAMPAHKVLPGIHTMVQTQPFNRLGFLLPPTA